jgi:acetyl-CoA/propionyl-CoA carboxylase, biotin carboxylase, biotin carboxyl carrier protein
MYDSMIAKLVVTGADRTEALQRARRALEEFQVEGMPTVIPFHRTVVNDPAFTDEPFRVHTRWIETEFDNTIAPYEGEAESQEAGEREKVTVEVGGKRIEVVLPSGLGGIAPAAGAGAGAKKKPSRRAGGAKSSAASGDSLTSPMQGTIVKIAVEEGQQVEAGELVIVLEAMKMEQPITAHKPGTVTGLAAEVGQTVTNGAVLLELT